ncbi:MAG TPA: hypothetical protein VGI40_27775 [Pirellulaceae bacterium]
MSQFWKPFVGSLFVVSLVSAIAGVVRADGPAWSVKSSLEAPEAHQAAAADDEFVFAIASKVVAKYDRRSGAKIAVSAGEAEHLNSGFLQDGKLYCAHSNYPKTPERSEIKVLDTQAMRLSTFKDFGNYGGSLTWAVCERGRWWCNFARYGNDNSQTFLVEFDEQWRELRRWTYPADVIRHIGQMSLSGGLWREGCLLVTDHDHPILYQLRLPDEGNELAFVATQSVPFTGQGIAADPVTGGLVGINRAKRQILFAERDAN